MPVLPRNFLQEALDRNNIAPDNQWIPPEQYIPADPDFYALAQREMTTEPPAPAPANQLLQALGRTAPMQAAGQFLGNPEVQMALDSLDFANPIGFATVPIKAAANVAGDLAQQIINPQRFTTRLQEFAKTPGFESLPYSQGSEAVRGQLQQMARKGKVGQNELDQIWRSIPEGVNLTPDELRAYIDNHGIKVEVERLDISPTIDELEDRAISSFEDAHGYPPDSDSDWQIVREFAREEKELLNRGEVVHQEHSLPGGENYREHVLTLPEANIPDAIDDAAESVFGKPFGELTPQQVETITRENYQTPHWPGIDNPAVHVRMDDRVIDGERVLFVGEVQSDWAAHNAGVIAAPKARKALEAFQDRMAAKYDKDWKEILISEMSDADKKVSDNLFERYDKVRQYEGQDVIPMPFDNAAWQDLAVQHILEEAVQGNYQRVAIITQDQIDSIPGLAYKGDLYGEGGILAKKLEKHARKFDSEAGVGSVNSVNPALAITPKLKENLKRLGQTIAGIGGIAAYPEAYGE